MNAQHTPGPWKWWTSNSYRRITAEGQQDGGVLSAVSSSGHADVRVSEEDARLIAAAPDLITFAEFVLRGLERGHIKSKPVLDFSNMDAAEVPMLSLHAMARAVIAKATGEQP